MFVAAIVCSLTTRESKRASKTGNGTLEHWTVTVSVWNSKGYLFPIMKSCKKILFRNDIVAPVFLGCQLVGGLVQSGSEKSRGCSSQGRELSSDTPVLLLLMWIIFFAHNHYQTFCVSYFFFHKRARRFYFFKLRNENRIWHNLSQDFYFFSGERWTQYIGRLLAIPESVPLMSREKDLEEGGGVATQEQSQI